MAVTTVSVHGRYLATDQTTPKAGTVTFTLTGVLRDTVAHNLICPAPIVATLDGTGAFTVTLLALDQAFVQPTDLMYKVVESITGQAVRGYFIRLAAAQPSVELADLVHL